MSKFCRRPFNAEMLSAEKLPGEQTMQHANYETSDQTQAETYSGATHRSIINHAKIWHKAVASAVAIGVLTPLAMDGLAAYERNVAKAQQHELAMFAQCMRTLLPEKTVKALDLNDVSQHNKPLIVQAAAAGCAKEYAPDIQNY